MVRHGRGWTVTLAVVVTMVSLGCSSERAVGSYPDELEAAGIDTLDMSVQDGSFDVVGEDGFDRIEVVVNLVTTRSNDEKDGEARHDMRLELRDLGDGTALLTVEDPGYDRYFANVTVTMPSELALVVYDGDGEGTIDRCAGLELADKGGGLDIGDVVGDVLIDDRAGDMWLTDVVGDVTIDDGKGDLTVIGVDGNVDIKDAGGQIAVEDVTGTVTIDDGAGDIAISNAGAVEIIDAGGGSLSID